uniref:ORF16 n=1 Tax=Physarum polycephalum TaxID=5791 RepID=Q9MJ66_PHYPO|nr:hypothetical protein PhpooMp17 [Physarum polycephalum]BAB08096.1 unnamed protein product [Physarum polycephalum]
MTNNNINTSPTTLNINPLSKKQSQRTSPNKKSLSQPKRYQLDSLHVIQNKLNPQIQEQLLAYTKTNHEKLQELYNRQVISHVHPETTHTALFQTYVQITSYHGKTTIPNACQLSRLINSMTKNTTLYFNRLILLIDLEPILMNGFRLSKLNILTPIAEYYNTMFSNAVLKETENKLINNLKDDSLITLYNKYLIHSPDERAEYVDIYLPLKDFKHNIKTYFNEINHLYHTSYRKFKLAPDLYVSAINNISPMFYQQCLSTLKQTMIDHLRFTQNKPTDLTYYFYLIKLMFFPEESDSYKVPLFTSEQKKQVEGYLSEHINLFVIQDFILSHYQVPPTTFTGNFQISKLINKPLDKFFGSTLSNNSYSLLINYLTSTTKIIFLHVETLISQAQSSSLRPLLNPFPSVESKVP